MLLSKELHTSMEFWLNQTIKELDLWIREFNFLKKEKT